MLVTLVLTLVLVMLTPCECQSGLRFVENLITRLEKTGVSENTKPGAYLGTLQCTDDLPDTYFRYYATNTDSINVNQLTGVVTLRKQFDFEQVSNNLDPNVKPNSVTFRCTDNRNDPVMGPLTLQEASVDLTIAVTDFNDNAPKFAVPAEGWTLFVGEEAAVGTVIAKGLTITDADRGANAQLSSLAFNCTKDADVCTTFSISYSLISEGKYNFSIRLIKNLDYETRSEYQTAVYAVDGLGTTDVPHLTTSVGLQIIVSDYQDQSPVFKNQNNNFQIDEGLPVGSLVNFALLAQDGDLGARRPIAFEIPKDYFRLRPPVLLDQGIYSAQLEVNAPIDREAMPNGYVFTAKATELDNGNLTNATVTKEFSCIIRDLNDNGPVFDNSTYSVEVPEVNTDRAKDQIPNFFMVVTDKDEPSNARFKLDIVNQTFSGAFSLTPDGVVTGTTNFYLIMTNMYRDYDVPAYRNQAAVIKATEVLTNGSTGPQTSLVTIKVTLTDINDHNPVFNQSVFVGYVPETAVNFTVIAAGIYASDDDSGQNAKIVYSLQDNVRDIFYIEQDTGILRLIGQLDYEKQREYSFQVYASDKGDRPRNAQAPVTIFVQDVNDVAPQFTQGLYIARVSESSLVFEGPVQVQATSFSNSNSTITYRIVSGNTPTNTFVLDSVTGVLTLSDYLDYEAIPDGKDFYTLSVEASDNGQPPLKTSSYIRVTVLDENDHSPVFSPTVYYFTLAETVAAGTVVANLKATDDDSGSNGEIKYRIGSGSRDNFEVDSTTGVMRIVNDPSFDYDEHTSYIIQVIATDGGSPQRSASATVSVTVLDTNNKPPTFVQALYVATVNESTPVGTSVLRVNATDPDADHNLRYSILAYTIQAQNQQGALLTSVIPYDFRNMFAVDTITGVIRVSSKLDRKYVVESTFDVQCNDVNGVANLPQTGSSRVTISISGTQDVTLQFDNNVVYITVSENQPFDKKIYTVQARDPANGFRVVNNYEIVPGTDLSPTFHVTQSNGEVFLARELDYDAGERDFSVQIRAIDIDGTRSATVTLSISVSDVNDMAPQFLRSSYSFRVSEDARPPYRVGVISAQDGDSATFGPIEYILGLGLNSDDFELITQPSGDGVLQVRNPLDYEIHKVYYLTVIGIDNPYLRGSAVRKSSSVSVTVSVLDVNDNTPTFRDTTKNFSIPATAAVGFPVSKIEAFDLDEGINGEIFYSLQATNDNEALSWFTISETGVLQTKAPFSAQNKRFDLKVVATDKGTPPLSSTLPITIKIQGTEEDDGTPQWYNFVNNFVAQAPEHEPNYTLSLRATATPRTPGAVSVYGLVPFGQDYQSFSVDPKTGAIVVKADLDREKQENYTLIISATDSLNSTLISRRTLIVNLLDKDDNLPTFGKTNYSACPTAFEVPTVVYADDNTPVHTIITYAKACDPDSAPYNWMSYELYTGNNSGTFLCSNFNSGAFNVNPNGSIETTRMLDYEERQEYLVCIMVRPVTSSNRRKREFDSRLMRPNDVVGYILVKIRDLNDNGPVFPNHTLTAVLQTLPTSDIVVQVAAVDPDGPQNNRVVYSLQNTVYYPRGGLPYTMNGAFSIGSSTGIVYINLPSYTDFAGGYFNLSIKAEDYLNPQFSDIVQLQIVLHERKQVLRIVMDHNPSDGNAKARELIDDLNSKGFPDTFFFILSISEHRTQGLPVATQTDVCFVVTSNNKIYDPHDGITLLDEPQYREVLSKTAYKTIDRGTCYQAQSSESQVKWRDLWWVLVAIAIFMFLCCVILLVTLHILYDRYKDQMRQPRMYMVTQ